MTDKEYKKLLAILSRLEKDKTFDVFFKNTPEPTVEERLLAGGPLGVPSPKNTFERIHTVCMVGAAQVLERIEDQMKIAKYYVKYCGEIYRQYKQDEAEIANPDILRYLRDYENYYKNKEEYETDN